ncbi:hypothetical protein IG631_23732 [Alternaria alternata]|nr:hypothetical protein IG631_23732 [Alternaria alternata]
MPRASEEDPLSSQQLQSEIREARLLVEKRNTSRRTASSTNSVYPGYPDSLNHIQTSGRTPILELPPKLLLLIGGYLDKRASLNASRMCKKLYEQFGMHKAFTAWEHLTNDPSAEKTMKLLKGLGSRDSQLLLVKGFERYRPGTYQRETLKSFLVERKNNSTLCTSLLRIDLMARLEQDAQFLLEHGANKREWETYEQSKEKHFKRRVAKNRFKRSQARLQRTAFATLADTELIRSLAAIRHRDTGVHSPVPMHTGTASGECSGTSVMTSRDGTAYCKGGTQ